MLLTCSIIYGLEGPAHLSHVSSLLNDNFFVFSEIMKQLFSCLLFIGICQIAISQTIGNPFRGLNKIKIPKEGVKSFSFQILNKGNITSHIEIRTRLVQGEKVNLAVLYGSQSESCMLSKSDRNFTSVTLCHDTNDKFAR